MGVQVDILNEPVVDSAVGSLDNLGRKNRIDVDMIIFANRKVTEMQTIHG